MAGIKPDGLCITKTMVVTSLPKREKDTIEYIGIFSRNMGQWALAMDSPWASEDNCRLACCILSTDQLAPSCLRLARVCVNNTA